jgi:hypothetical protein
MTDSRQSDIEPCRDDELLRGYWDLSTEEQRWDLLCAYVTALDGLVVVCEDGEVRAAAAALASPSARRILTELADVAEGK